MKKAVLTLFLLSGIITSNAQFLKTEWSNKSGSTQNDAANSIVVESNDENIYTTGIFRATVDFDPGPGSCNLNSVGKTDIFITKTSVSGQIRWVRSIGGLGEDCGNSIVTDNSGFIYITGNFHDTVDFDPDSINIYNLISNGESDIFILKLDTSGKFIWAKSIGGISEDMSYSIGKFDNGLVDICITGSFSATVDFDPGSNKYNLISEGDLDAFILKLNKNGIFQWVKKVGGGGTDRAFSITGAGYVGVEGLLICGSFQDSGDFDPGPAESKLTSNGSDDIFLLKLDPAGKFKWVRGIGNIGSDIPYSIVSNSNELFMTGFFHDSVNFGGILLMSAGGSDIFVAHLDASNGGIISWCTSIGGVEDDTGYSVWCHEEDNLFVTGTFKGKVDFDPTPNGEFYLNSGSHSNTFVLNLDKFGNQPCGELRSAIQLDQQGYGNSGNSVAGFSYDYSFVCVAGSISNGTNSDIFVNKYSLQSTEIKHTPATKYFSIYPNPTNAVFNIHVLDSKDKYSIEVFNALGTLICKKNIAGSSAFIDLGSYGNGIYLVKLLNDKETITTQKIIKQ